jgi:LmbE family N-acetylglucosaminyl deacetylase
VANSVSAAAVGAVFVALAAIAAAWIVWRHRRYQRHIRYDPRQNYAADLLGSCVETIEIDGRGDGLLLPDVAGAVSGFLEVTVSTAWARPTGDPEVSIGAAHFSDSQTFERGAQGRRMLNVSRLLASGISAGERVTLQGRHVTVRADAARIHLSRERVQPGERVLVVAPHPDDAEIAAFGLYTETAATVVTLTAGDASDRYAGAQPGDARLSRSMVAKMRVWDSLTVPQLGGLDVEHVLNLCYPDGRLREMHADPLRDFRIEDHDVDFDELRRLNRSSLIAAGSTYSWQSLVEDLAAIVAAIKPGVVVTPHPWLDPHVDHLFTTAAVCEAIGSTATAGGRFYFYVNHNRRTELWPFGPSGSGVGMVPLMAGDRVGCDGFYSHPLSAQRQLEKYVAIEAMHDLRDVGGFEPRPSAARARRAATELAAAASGMSEPPTSYLRRAVRPDEIFFTTSFEKGRALCASVLRDAGCHAGIPH